MFFIDDYKLEKKLGNGSYGDVFYTTQTNSNMIFATKKIDKNRIKAPHLKSYFLNEIDILKNTDHENIIKLFDIKITENNFYMVMEYCNGGSLIENYNKYFLKHSKALPEMYVQHILRQIACGLYYLHKCNIIHRDLKQENLLLHYCSEEDRENVNILNAKLKIIDFGFAKYLNENHIARSICGSPISMDPIILEALAYNKPEEEISYNEKADLWSVGIIIYHLLIGRPPFSGYSYKDLYSKIDKGTYNIPKSLRLSKQAISLINGLLKFDEKDRLGIDQLIYHEFLIKDVKDFEYYDLNLKDNLNDDNLILSSKEDCSKIWDLYKTDPNTNLSLIKGNLERKSIIPEDVNQKGNNSKFKVSNIENLENIFDRDFNFNTCYSKYVDCIENNSGAYCNNKKLEDLNKNININNKLQTENDILLKDNYNYVYNNYEGNKNENEIEFNYRYDKNYNIIISKNNKNRINNRNNLYDNNYNYYNKKSESSTEINNFRKNSNIDDYRIERGNALSDKNLNFNYAGYQIDTGAYHPKFDFLKKDREYNKYIIQKYEYMRRESEKLHNLITIMKSDLEKDREMTNKYVPYKYDLDNTNNKYSNLVVENKPFENNIKSDYISNDNVEKANNNCDNLFNNNYKFNDDKIIYGAYEKINKENKLNKISYYIPNFDNY